MTSMTLADRQVDGFMIEFCIVIDDGDLTCEGMMRLLEISPWCNMETRTMRRELYYLVHVPGLIDVPSIEHSYACISDEQAQFILDDLKRRGIPLDVHKLER